MRSSVGFVPLPLAMMMSAILCVSLLHGAESFQASPSPLSTTTARVVSRTSINVYVPDGFTAESYKKFKEEENKKNMKKNLGGVGPRGFKSRSMQSFQEALERGEAAHLLPVFNAKEKIARGELKQEDIPYMQRGGSWDNSDVKGAKKKRWLNSDKEYAAGGYKKEQSVSIFGFGEGLDWTGDKARSGPPAGYLSIKAPKFAKNYKAPNVYELKGMKAPKASKDSEEKPKKFFGLF